MKYKSFLWLLWLVPAAALFMLITSFTKGTNKNHQASIVAYTKSVTNITSMTANCNYRVTVLDPGKVKGHGVCVSSRPLPLITHVNFPSSAPIQRAADYMVKLTSLRPSSTLYARSYVKVDTGVVYGNAVAFTTLPPAQKPK
ncbi:MAG: hypothetical protein IPH18_12195 [Chitinophagaceae bacterium]|nr:hypothetical protein [Chitinophagaceae bacterium]MBK8951911.1 hypothetical protein [Chitinophagaceae bacterium]